MEVMDKVLKKVMKNTYHEPKWIVLYTIVEDKGSHGYIIKDNFS